MIPTVHSRRSIVYGYGAAKYGIGFTIGQVERLCDIHLEKIGGGWKDPPYFVCRALTCLSNEP